MDEKTEKEKMGELTQGEGKKKRRSYRRSEEAKERRQRKQRKIKRENIRPSSITNPCCRQSLMGNREKVVTKTCLHQNFKNIKRAEDSRQKLAEPNHKGQTANHP